MKDPAIIDYARQLLLTHAKMSFRSVIVEGRISADEAGLWFADMLKLMQKDWIEDHIKKRLEDWK